MFHNLPRKACKRALDQCYRAWLTLLCARAAGGWDAEGYALLSSRDDKPVRVRGRASLDEDFSCSSAITGQPLLVKGRSSGLAAQQAAGCYMLPMEFSASSEQRVVRAATLSRSQATAGTASSTPAACHAVLNEVGVLGGMLSA